MARVIGTIVLFILYLQGLAQPPDAISIQYRAFQNSTIRLDSNWLYHPGHDSTWAQKELNDSSWTNVNLNSFFDTRTNQNLWQGEGWFRYHLQIDNTLFGKTVAFSIDHYGASAIYLNGRLLKKFGRPAHSPQEEKLHNPVQKVFYGEFAPSSNQVIAIHYSENRLSPRLPSGFQLQLGSSKSVAEQWVRETQNKAMINLIRLGVFGAFALIHLLLFFYYPKQKANLFFSLFIGFYALNMAINYYLDYTTDTQTIIQWGGITEICWILTYISGAALIYTLYYQYLPRLIWISILIGSLTLIGYLAFPALSLSILDIPLRAWTYFEVFRMVVKGIRKGYQWMWIVGTGTGLAILNFILLATGVFNQWDISPFQQDILETGGFLLLPLTFSIVLARNFARVNTDLTQKLNEVQQLSQTNLNHEKEKQKILNEQKTKLEKTVQERTREITRQNRQLAQQKEAISEQAERLKALDEAKNRFITNITHEFKTPLTLIIGPAESIQQTTGDPKIQKNLQTILHNTRNLQSLIGQLLDLNQLKEDQLALHPQRKDMVSFLNQIIQSFEPHAREKEISLTFIPAITKPEGDIDPPKLERILSNLLSNALKFTPSGGKITVEISNDKNEENMILRIQDTGEGIAEEDLQYIFDRFYQADNSMTRTTGGTGIGLAVVKALTELHGGTIEVESQPGKGTRFIIKIPRKNSEIHEEDAPVYSENSPSAAAMKMEASVNGQHPGKEKQHQERSPKAPQKMEDKILIIEDHKDVRRFMASTLETFYTIIEAENGKTGIQKAREQVPDMIICDVMMPEMDGFEVCRNLKQDQATDHIPVIMLTAKTDLNSKLEGLQTGADDYLGKPFSTKELLARINNLITSREKLREKFSQNLITEVSPEGTSPPSFKFIDHLKNIMLEHIHEETFDITQLCRTIGLSRSQLHRKLKALAGLSTTRFMHIIRLEYAKKLLQENDYTVAEVAYMVGFSSPPYFTKCFNGHYGITPSRFRETVGDS